MKSILGMFATLLSVVLLTIYPNDLRAQELEKPWICKGKCRTWVVYHSDAAHMKEGDRFQMRKSDGKTKLVALSRLRGRWGEASPTSSIQLDLIEFGGTQYRGNTKNRSRLCGFPNIPIAVSDTHKAHMFKIKLDVNDTLKITWKEIDNSSDIDTPEKRKNKCEEGEESLHGGTAHAEPD